MHNWGDTIIIKLKILMKGSLEYRRNTPILIVKLCKSTCSSVKICSRTFLIISKLSSYIYTRNVNTPIKMVKLNKNETYFNLKLKNSFNTTGIHLLQVLKSHRWSHEANKRRDWRTPPLRISLSSSSTVSYSSHVSCTTLVPNSASLVDKNWTQFTWW